MIKDDKYNEFILKDRIARLNHNAMNRFASFKESISDLHSANFSHASFELAISRNANLELAAPSKRISHYETNSTQSWLATPI